VVEKRVDIMVVLREGKDNILIPMYYVKREIKSTT
jgi:hypothetical protein